MLVLSRVRESLDCRTTFSCGRYMDDGQLNAKLAVVDTVLEHLDRKRNGVGPS